VVPCLLWAGDKGAMLQTERSKQLEYNLGVLKRRDAAITRILDMAGHVVLYKFNEDTKQWDRKNVEGSLFVVERSTEPSHQFVVLNRLSSENLVESINENFQTELTDQFLLYRNLNAEILGVWFYSPPERAAVAELLDSLTGGQTPAGEDDATTAPGNTEAEPNGAADVATQGGGDAAAVAPSAAPPSNVAEFFSMMAGAQEAPPPMPTSAVVAGDAVSGAAPAAADSAACTVGVAAASAAPPPSSAAPAAAATSATARPPIDMEALKAKLALQLRALVDDDAFLSMLATEYLRQQQRALQQAQQQRQNRLGRGAPLPPTPASAAAQPADSVAAHLSGLLQQQASM